MLDLHPSCELFSFPLFHVENCKFVLTMFRLRSTLQLATPPDASLNVVLVALVI